MTPMEKYFAAKKAWRKVKNSYDSNDILWDRRLHAVLEARDAWPEYEEWKNACGELEG